MITWREPVRTDSDCRIRIIAWQNRPLVIVATVQLGSQVTDTLEVSPALGPEKVWMPVQSWTNCVAPEPAHFESGCTEIAYECEPSVLPGSASRFIRLKRAWPLRWSPGPLN